MEFEGAVVTRLVGVLAFGVDLDPCRAQGFRGRVAGCREADYVVPVGESVTVEYVCDRRGRAAHLTGKSDPGGLAGGAVDLAQLCGEPMDRVVFGIELWRTSRHLSP